MAVFEEIFMHIPVYKRLWFQVLYRISIVIGIIIVGTFFFIIKQEKQHIIKNEKEYVLKLSESIEKSLNHGMIKNDFVFVGKTLEELAGKDIKSIRVINKNGKVIVSSRSSESGKMLPSSEALCNHCHDGTIPKRDKFVIFEQKDSIKVVNLLFNSTACNACHSPAKAVLGALVMDVSKEDANMLIKQSLARMLGSAVITFIVMVILTFLVITLFVTCPIKDLMKAMLDASRGNMNVQVAIPSENEFGVLAKTFNFMVQRLRELHDNDVNKEREIAKMQESLRYKAELETLNIQLKSRVSELESANNKIENMIDDIEEKNYHLEKAIDRLKILYGISRCLTTVLNPDDVIKMIVEKSVSIMKAKTGSLMIVDESKDELYIKYSVGLDASVVSSTKVKVGNSISGWVAKQAKPLIVKNIETDERFRMISKTTYETKSLISAPVVIKGEVVGVLNVNNKLSGNEFTEDELELLNTLAGQTAVSLENANLYENLQQNYFNTVRALVNAIEAKDTYTRGHSERVTSYALELGRRLNLSPQRMEILQHAAILHDIGKIGTDLGILHKAGLLTDEEYEVVKEHPIIGSQIIEPIEFLVDVKRIITEHHEKYDGTGYPEGKKGDELTIEARIIAIADAYDAMTTDRPYRSAMQPSGAMAELIRCAGQQFDSQLVEIFKTIILNGTAEAIFQSSEKTIL